MPLPVEDDWKPRLGDNRAEEDEYEEHVKMLAELLRQVNMVAGQQSKMSRETAKLSYDRQTKLE